MGDAFDRARRIHSTWLVRRDNCTVVSPALLPFQKLNGPAVSPDVLPIQNLLALLPFQISNGSAVLPDLLPNQNQSGFAVNEPGPTAAWLPFNNSEQAHKKGLPWFRRFFQRNWSTAQPNPKSASG